VSTGQTPRIPDHLLRYDESAWLPRVEPGALYPALRARQLWIDAQVEWCAQHRIWSGDFERLRQQQLAEPSTSGNNGE